MQVDADLRSIQEVRDLVRQAKEAAQGLASLSQEEVDRLVARMAEAGRAQARRLAEDAAAETGFGVVADKETKNIFATERVHQYIAPLRTVGVIGEDPAAGLVEIAEPVGVIAGITPSTNPTSTVMYKALISVKARNPVVFCPHPAAAKCSHAAARLMEEAIVAAGGPKGAVGCVSEPTGAASQELMRHPDVALILATGGTPMVRAAYSSGKPAFGVGPGNVPAFIERSADLGKAVRDIMASKTFDNGTICASEQAVIVEPPLQAAAESAFSATGAYFLSEAEAERVGRVVVRPDGSINPKVVGRPAAAIAALAQLEVPQATRVLMARLTGVGPQFPLSKEKLSPVLAFYVEEDWHQACLRCIELLKFGGIGHTMVIHSRDEAIIREFALKKPVFRILVNTPAALGAIGHTTGLPPALTLGCGTWGGSATSDNVTPLHLINRKRLAYEVRGLEAGAAAAAIPAPFTADRAQIERLVREHLARLLGSSAGQPGSL